MAVQFNLQISKMADFAKASNFINKVTGREELNGEETENVSFMQVRTFSCCWNATGIRKYMF